MSAHDPRNIINIPWGFVLLSRGAVPDLHRVRLLHFTTLMDLLSVLLFYVNKAVDPLLFLFLYEDVDPVLYNSGYDKWVSCI